MQTSLTKSVVVNFQAKLQSLFNLFNLSISFEEKNNLFLIFPSCVIQYKWRKSLVRQRKETDTVLNALKLSSETWSISARGRLFGLNHGSTHKNVRNIKTYNVQTLTFQNGARTKNIRFPRTSKLFPRGNRTLKIGQRWTRQQGAWRRSEEGRCPWTLFKMDSVSNYKGREIFGILGVF